MGPESPIRIERPVRGVRDLALTTCERLTPAGGTEVTVPAVGLGAGMSAGAGGEHGEEIADDGSQRAGRYGLVRHPLRLPTHGWQVVRARADARSRVAARQKL